MVEQVVAHDCAAILLYDPINIRYALDVSNMQVWAAHSPIHSALVFADGHAIDFEYAATAHLAEGLETVDEVRPALAWFYLYSAENLAEWVERWAASSWRRCASGRAAASCGWRSTGSTRRAPTRSAGTASRWSRARS